MNIGQEVRKSVVAAAALAFIWTGMAEAVANVRGTQREDTHLVDIYYDLEASDGGTYFVEVAIVGKTAEVRAASFSGDVGIGISPGKNHHIVWNAGADWPDHKDDVKAVVTTYKRGDHGKVQLWKDGPYWATTNVGADYPWEAGLYFWWGDTVGYKREGSAWVATDGSSSNFQFNEDPISLQSHKNISIIQSEGWIVSQDGTYALAPEHDAAHVKWGGDWRMPTYQELCDLCYNKCDWTWTTKNGVNGYVVRGRGDYASNSIFLPAAGYGLEASLCDSGLEGYIWSSVPDSDSYDDCYACGLEFYSSHYHDVQYYFGRGTGLPVRPVQGFIEEESQTQPSTGTTTRTPTGEGSKPLIPANTTIN